MIEELKKHLQSVGKTDESWLDLAKRFNILPNGTNKQRSDKVRKVYNNITKLDLVIDPEVRNKEIFVNKITELLCTNKITPLEFQNYCNSYPNVPQPNTIMTTGTTNLWGSPSDYPFTAPFSNPYKNPYVHEEPAKVNSKDWEEFEKWKQSKDQIKPKTLKPYLKGNVNNVLIVSDIHEPFCKKGYLEFCRSKQETFNCGTVVFIGDVIDQHFSSFHNIDPDGLGGAMELEQAVERLKVWHEVFPNAIVTIGKHDKIISRKLYSSGVSQRWMKPLQEVLETPTWKYVTEFNFNNVLYTHGEGSTASKKAQNELCSVVQGHLHTEGYIQLFNGGKNFAMQVGTGIDFEQYAFAYAQRGKKPILSCGVVMNDIAFLIPFIN